MKKIVIAAAVAALMAFGHTAARAEDRNTPAWLTNQIDCRSPEEFAQNYLIAIGNAPVEYYTDITIIMYLIYYTSQRVNGNDSPFGNDFDENEAFHKSLLPLYKACKKEPSFSLAHLVSFENAIKKEHPQYYDEFMINYYKPLYETLKNFHGK